MDLKPGTLVTANVRLVEPLAKGAMGSVWIAEHVFLRTKVAVKFIAERLVSADPEAVARFHREAACAAQIKSPHVVQTFDQGLMTDGTPYIVMELLEGESLRQRIERHGRLTLRQTALVVAHVAKALHKAHKHRIVHRDIKPENIFLSVVDEGERLVKVLDFGTAKQTHVLEDKKLTVPGVLIGTPEYMSREQVMQAEEVDYRADLWALAVAAYEALTGQVPFPGDTLGQVCVAICNGRFAPPSSLVPELPEAVDQWFEKAFDTDSEHRFGSAKQMALAFVRLVPDDADNADEPVIYSNTFSVTPPPGDASSDVVIPLNPLPSSLALAADEPLLDDDPPSSENWLGPELLGRWSDPGLPLPSDAAPASDSGERVESAAQLPVDGGTLGAQAIHIEREQDRADNGDRVSARPLANASTQRAGDGENPSLPPPASWLAGVGKRLPTVVGAVALAVAVVAVTLVSQRPGRGNSVGPASAACVDPPRAATEANRPASDRKTGPAIERASDEAASAALARSRQREEDVRPASAVPSDEESPPGAGANDEPPGAARPVGRARSGAVADRRATAADEKQPDTPPSSADPKPVEDASWTPSATPEDLGF